MFLLVSLSVFGLELYRAISCNFCLALIFNFSLFFLGPICMNFVAPPGCTVTPDCLTFSCDVATQFFSEVYVQAQLMVCLQQPLSAIITITGATISPFSQSMTSGQSFPVPGLSVPGVGPVQVSLYMSFSGPNEELSVSLLLQACSPYLPRCIPVYNYGPVNYPITPSLLTC